MWEVVGDKYMYLTYYVQLVVIKEVIISNSSADELQHISSVDELYCR